MKASVLNLSSKLFNVIHLDNESPTSHPSINLFKSRNRILSGFLTQSKHILTFKILNIQL